MPTVSQCVVPFAWKLPAQLPDDLRYVRMVRLPAPILSTLQSLKPPAPRMTPIASLHDGLGTFSPAILAFDNPLHDKNGGASWMYVVDDAVLDVHRLETLIKVWLQTCYRETGQKLAAAWGELNHVWSRIDLQTADDRLRRLLLPGLVARWLLHQDYMVTLMNEDNEYDHPLRLVPLMTQRGVAELISEPQEVDGAFYSVVMRFWLQDIPESAGLVLLNKASMRRWITRSLLNEKGWLDMKIGRGKSVYLRRSTGYLDGCEYDDVFTRITLKRTGIGAEELHWMGNQARLFDVLSLHGAPPDELELVRQPEKFLDIALVTAESRNLRTGDAGSGLYSGDHWKLYTDLNTRLKVWFEPMPLWSRVITGDTRRGAKTPSQQPEKVDAITRLERLAALHEPVYIDLHLEDVVLAKQTILSHVGALELYQDRLDENPLCVMDGNRLLLEIRQGSDPTLTLPLPESANVDARRRAENMCHDQIARKHRTDHASAGALVALENYREFVSPHRQRDPKAAIRSGLIAGGRVSQFFVPHKTKETPKDYERRMKNAVADLLRTLGYRFNPFYEQPEASSLPADLDLMALWLFQLNARNRSEQTVMLPVMIDVPAGYPHLRVLLPNRQGTGTAEIYPTLQEGIMAANDYTSDFSKPGEVVNFFDDAMLKRDPQRPGLLLISDQNLRRIYYDELGRYPGSSPLSLSGLLENLPEVRVARLRFSRFDEAPFCLSGSGMAKYQGLYGHADYPNTFYSLHNIGDRHQSLKFRRLEDIDAGAANSSTLQIHMNNLQPDDDPAAWAGLVHRLRLESSHTGNPTLYPQPLHDMQIMKDYLSRLIDENEDDEDDLNVSEGATL